MPAPKPATVSGSECSLCGALIVKPVLHAQWHLEVDGGAAK